MVSIKRILFNLGTFVPGVTRLPFVKRVLRRRSIGTGGTNSGRYCYSVWLRHLVMASENGLNIDPQTIAELGPGDSVGVGLAALLSGASQYYAVDVVAHANTERNLLVLEELISLFHARADIPGPEEFPSINPTLTNYTFPGHVLTDARLREALDERRLEKIRSSLRNWQSGDSMIQYRAPWTDVQLIERGAIDLIVSQAVLEHIDDLSDVYRTMSRWLAKDGFVSHQIDFTSHGLAEEWNGHWAYSDFMWGIVRGKDYWMINREPKSTHLRLLEREGFRIAGSQTGRSPNAFSRKQFASRFRELPEDDLTAPSVFLQAVRSR